MLIERQGGVEGAFRNHPRGCFCLYSLSCVFVVGIWLIEVLSEELMY